MPCAPVTAGEDLSFMKPMRKRCIEFNGVGLAAPQIGVLKRVIFIWQGQSGYGFYLINPEIVAASDMKVSAREGCLSYPGLETFVARHEWIRVKFFLRADRELNTEFTQEYRGMEARIVQHEIDHLDGICKVGDAWKAGAAA